MAFKKLYWDRRKKGMCVSCGGNKAVPTKARCPYCLEEARVKSSTYNTIDRRQYLKDRRKRLILEGKCTRCGGLKPSQTTTIECPNCCSGLTGRAKTLIDYTLYYPGGSYEAFNKKSST